MWQKRSFYAHRVIKQGESHMQQACFMGFLCMNTCCMFTVMVLSLNMVEHVPCTCHVDEPAFARRLPDLACVVQTRIPRCVTYVNVCASVIQVCIPYTLSRPMSRYSYELGLQTKLYRLPSVRLAFGCCMFGSGRQTPLLVQVTAKGIAYTICSHVFLGATFSDNC